MHLEDERRGILSRFLIARAYFKGMRAKAKGAFTRMLHILEADQCQYRSLFIAPEGLGR